MLPHTNGWAAIGAAIAAILVFVLEALVKFFSTGQAWPITAQGWLMIVIPALAAGLLAVLTPAASVHEARTGARKVTLGRDAPVVVMPKIKREV